MDFSVLTKKSSHFCWQESIESQREPCSSARFMDGSGPLLLISPSDAAQIRTRKIEEKKTSTKKKNGKHDFHACLRILLRFTHARLGKVRAAVKLPRASWKTSPVRFFGVFFYRRVVHHLQAKSCVTGQVVAPSLTKTQPTIGRIGSSCLQ